MAVGLGASIPAAAQPCGPRWTNPAPIPDVVGSVYALAVYDADGDGPAPAMLYAGGLFSSVSGVPAHNIARWDGIAWSAVGPEGAAGTDGAVFALVVFDDDGDGPNPPVLCVGGDFAAAGGEPVASIARWDGADWGNFGDGLSGGAGGVRALEVFDDDGAGPNPAALYAGGFFSNSGLDPTPAIARWTGTAWTAVGGGINEGVLALAVFDDDGPGPIPPALYAGGPFTFAGASPVSRIARWDGVAWGDVAGGVAGEDPVAVRALLVHDEDGAGPLPPALFAGGSFGTAGVSGARNIAKWDGSAWSALGSGVGGGAAPVVEALWSYDDDGAGPNPAGLFAAGRFASAGPATAANVARWEPTGGWTSLSIGVDSPDAFVYTLITFDKGSGEELFIGGEFGSCGGVTTNNIARWNGEEWAAVSVDLRITGDVRALGVLDEDGRGPGGRVAYTGGDFEQAGGLAARNVVRLDGDAWETLGKGTNGPVMAIIGWHTDGHARAIAGGEFTAAGGSPASHLAEWNGTVWTELGGGLNGTVRALAVYDEDGPGPVAPVLFVGGDFTIAGVNGSAVAASRIARWDGAAWSALGAGVNGPVRALAVFDDDGPGPGSPALYVGGEFDAAGEVSASGIARWDGAAWSALDSGVTGGAVPAVFALCVFDPDGFGGMQPPVLVAGGRFGFAGGAPAGRIAAWNGTAWQSMGGFNGPSGTEVRALAVLDLDAMGPQGPTLFAGGSFTSPALSVARWTGAGWANLGTGIGFVQVHALAGLDPDGAGPRAPSLLVGGSFGLRAWGACDAGCVGDADRNGTVEPGDVTLYVSTWMNDLMTGHSAADINNDGVLDPLDVALFVQGWFEGLTSGCN